MGAKILPFGQEAKIPIRKLIGEFLKIKYSRHHVLQSHAPYTADNMAFHGNRGGSRGRSSRSGPPRGRGGARGGNRGRGGFRGGKRPIFDSARVAQQKEE